MDVLLKKRLLTLGTCMCVCIIELSTCRCFEAGEFEPHYIKRQAVFFVALASFAGCQKKVVQSGKIILAEYD